MKVLHHQSIIRRDSHVKFRFRAEESLNRRDKQFDFHNQPLGKNPGKDFTRNRKLPFEKVIDFILCMGGESLTNELIDHFGCTSEETIFRIGTIEKLVSPETIVLVVGGFYEEFEKCFSSHVHILDRALHLDEGTPHVHDRHVFDCENKYGELCSQQKKTLEALGVSLTNPDKPRGRNNDF